MFQSVCKEIPVSTSFAKTFTLATKFQTNLFLPWNICIKTKTVKTVIAWASLKESPNLYFIVSVWCKQNSTSRHIIIRMDWAALAILHWYENINSYLKSLEWYAIPLIFHLRSVSRESNVYVPYVLCRRWTWWLILCLG